MQVILEGEDKGMIADILKDGDLPLYDALVDHAKNMFVAYDLQLITITKEDVGQPKVITSIFDKLGACRDAIVIHMEDVRDARERSMLTGLGNQISHLIAYWELREGKSDDKAFDSSD